MHGMCKSSNRQSGCRADSDSRNSAPEGKLSTSKAKDRSSLVNALRIGSSSSTTAIKGLDFVTMMKDRLDCVTKILDLGPMWRSEWRARQVAMSPATCHLRVSLSSFG